MTNEQIMKLADGYTFTWDEDVLKFARAVERQALERAAEQADMLRSKFSSNGKVYDAAAANQVRLAIRALINQPASKENQR